MADRGSLTEGDRLSLRFDFDRPRSSVPAGPLRGIMPRPVPSKAACTSDARASDLSGGTGPPSQRMTAGSAFIAQSGARSPSRNSRSRSRGVSITVSPDQAAMPP